jgi:hypothetical protein
MYRVIVVVALATAFALPDGARPISLTDLTVPADRLPNGCALSAAPSERISGNTFASGLWAGLRIPANPWAGNDRPLIAEIRERIDEPTKLPDGPPLSEGELVRFRVRLADGIDEGYAAIYREGTPAHLVIVYALRVANNGRVDAVGTRRTSPDVKSVRVLVGQIVAVVSGNAACFDAVVNYVRSLLP